MEVVWLIVLFIFGACVGSFLNVVIYRLPRGQSIVFPGSHCPSCGRPIRWYDNIPILSWIALGGRCRQCDAPISPRYIIIEAATAVIVPGLYACYFILDLRDGTGSFADAWPMFIAHAALLCGLLVCSVVDAESWIIPLEVMWVCAIIGAAAAAFEPGHSLMPGLAPDLAGASFAAALGLVIGVLLLRAGIIQPSFLDVEEPPSPAPREKRPRGRKPAPKSVAITTEHGVNPRREILRELAFLAPAILLAIAAALLLHYVPAVGRAWRGLLDAGRHPWVGPRLAGLAAAVFGYLVGGAWIWGMRIAGTLAFGKEAMGLGDVHILAGVGAVTGWVVPSVAFFVAPFFGLAWALWLWMGRRQRELPYGPWLAVASAVVMIFHDGFVDFLGPSLRGAALLLGRGG
jgi:leader peptidase (prepilin peptidase)/N-methyltransferase